MVRHSKKDSCPPWLLYGDMEPLGGAHRYFCDMLQVLDVELRPTLIALPSPAITPEVKKIADESGAELLPLRFQSRWDYSSFRTLKDAIRKQHIRHANLQLSSLFWSGKMVFATLHLSGVKHLAVTAHAIGPPNEGLIKAALRWAETRLGSLFITDWLALARYDWPIFRDLGASHAAITLLPPSVPIQSVEAPPDWTDLTREGSATGVKRWIGFVGVLRRAKGVFELLDAFASISAEFDDVGLLVIGDGEEKKKLHDRCTELSLAHRVVFTGHRADGRGLLKKCSICVLPSHTEHYPFVLLEAMAEGIPIVATRVGAVPEMLSYGERGVLVPPKDTIALATALTAVLDNKVEVQECTAKAREFVKTTSALEHFTEEVNTFHRCWLGLEREKYEDRS